MELFNADIINVDAEEAWEAHVANIEAHIGTELDAMEARGGPARPDYNEIPF